MLGYGTGIFCFIPRLWGTRVWINTDGIEWMRAKWGRLGKIWFKLMEFLATVIPNRVISDSEGIRKYLMRRHRHLSPSSSVIPYGTVLVRKDLDPGVLDRWGFSPWEYYLVVCRLEPENHVLEILRGFLTSRSLKRLVVVGDRNTGTAYTRKLLSLKDSRLHFIGTIYDRDVLMTLRFFAFAYFHGHSVGGTNPSLLEAMGCRNTIVAHNNVFNREVAGDAAVYFGRAEDIPPLVDLLESFPVQREDMRERAYQITKSRYTWESVLDRYYELLEQDDIR
jgi:glycosyltransferase involved in cell wall biosynthesis